MCCSSFLSPVTEAACEAPVGFIEDGTDCDDGDIDISPGEDELCDGIDNNCDTAVDDATAVDQPTWYPDADGDAYGDVTAGVTACEAPADYLSVGRDCNDADATINPGASELCDGINNDCNAATTETGKATWTAADGTVTDATATLKSGTSSSPVAIDVDGTIDFCSGTWYVALTATDDLQLVGHIASGTRPILDGGSSQTILAIETDGITVGVDPLTFQHGEATAVSATAGRTIGGGVECLADSELGLSNVLATSNHAGIGGFLYSEGCDVTISSSTISTNTGDYGGGMFFVSGDVLIEDSQIKTNTATGAGGGFGVQADTGVPATVDLVDTIVQSNTAYFGGGMSVLFEGTVTCTATSSNTASIISNVASYIGGGVLTYADTYTPVFQSDGCNFGEDGGTDDNLTTDVYVYDTSASYEYGTSATFTCTGTSCI